MLKLFVISSLLLAAPAAAKGPPISTDILPICRASIVATAKGDDDYLKREVQKRYPSSYEQLLVISGCVLYAQGILDGMAIGTEKGVTNAVSYLRYSN